MNLKCMLFSTLFSLECEATCERKQGIKYGSLETLKIPCNDKGL